MQSNQLEILNYKITSEPLPQNEEYGVDEQLEQMMASLYHDAIDGRKSAVKKFKKLIEKYPKNPILKNYLSSVYQERGDMKNARMVNREIIEKHPDYLFARLNLAQEYFGNDQFDKMPEVMGEFMEIKALYPEREVFHLSEVLNFNRLAVMYFGAVDKLDQAEQRLDIMQELAPDHEMTDIALDFFTHCKMMENLKETRDWNEAQIEVVCTGSLPEQKQEAPVFTHPEIDFIYENGQDIPEKVLKKIVVLPRETLIQDLEKVLMDSMERYDFFVKSDLDEDYNSFVLHAFFLLGELEASESIEVIFRVLSQKESYLAYWFGDFLTEIMWQPVYKIVQNELDKCKCFACAPGIYPFAKTIITNAVSQLAFHQPQRRGEVIEWYGDVLKFILAADLEDNVIDSDVLGSMVNDLIELRATELLPIIKQIYDLEYISKMDCGDFAEIQSDIKLPLNDCDKREFLSIQENYHYLESLTDGLGDLTDELENLRFEKIRKEFMREHGLSNSSNRGISDDGHFFEENDSMPIIKEAKPGRNDLCPCGSGKKYKKCCL